MNTPTQPVSFSVASSADIEQTARQLAAIRETFLATGSTGGLLLRDLIHASWQRCQALAVDADRNLAQFAASTTQHLHLLREQNAPLLGAAQPVLLRLNQQLGEGGYVVALSDAHGNLLEVGGNRERWRALACKGLLPGSNWSEAAAGTNAIGTALATGRVVQLLAAEHYCAGWQDVTCTAAPIFHPATGAIIGALDIAGDYRLVRPFMAGVLAIAALEVQQQWYTHQPREHPTREPMRMFNGVRLRASPISTPVSASSAPSPPSPHDADRRADYAERLAAATGAISASLDLRETLRAVATQIGQVLQLGGAAVCLVRETSGVPSYIWEQASTTYAVSEALCLLLKQPLVMAWCHEHAPLTFARSFPAEIAPILEAADVRALALLPLATARGPMGVIVAVRPDACAWDVDALRLGLAVATHAATALENALMFTELRRAACHNAALNAMASFLATLIDPSKQLDLVLQQIAEITDFDAGLMVLREPPAAELAVVARHGLPTDASTTSPSAALLDLVTPVVTNGIGLQMCQQHTPSVATGTREFCDLVAVPLALHNAVIGVLVMAGRQHRTVSDEDVTLFTSIGQQLGLAISNAQLRRAAGDAEALREVNRLKSTFLAAVSHDLRSPLTAIRASVEGLIEHNSVNAPYADALLHNIARQASRLGRFVDQLLDLSSIEAGQLALDREWVDLAALLDDVLLSFQQRYADTTLQRAISPDLPLHYLDPALCTQVVWNILENAYKYGGASKCIRVEAFCAGEHSVISVADRGLGVLEAERTRIFEHFYRSKRDRRTHTSGSGLGLAICRGIVEAHNGRIWVDDRPGGGCIFRVTLPLTLPDQFLLHSIADDEAYPQMHV